MSRSKIRCAACKKKIPAHEPDVMLRRLDAERVRYYHTRCTEARERPTLFEIDALLSEGVGGEVR